MGYNWRRKFMKRKIFLLSLVAAVLTFAIAGCQREGCTDPKATNYDSDAKKDNGTCVYAAPEPQPTEPTKVITMDWNWETALWEDLNRDTIAYYAAQPDVKTIVLFTDKDAPVEHPENHGGSTTSGGLSSGFSTRAFHTVRDSLQKRFDISPKVVGSGTIVVHSQGGAQQSDQTGYSCGMNLEDSIWYASKGFTIKRNGAAK